MRYQRKPLTAFAKAYVWDRTDGHCWYCGLRLNPFTTFAVDHIMPVSQGGTNALINLIPACRSCNSRKGAGPYDRLREHLGVREYFGERMDLEVDV